MLFTCWLCQRALKRVAQDFHISIDYRDCIKEIKVLWQFSLPSMLANSLVIPVTWICNAMLVNQPGGYAEMGIYSAATQWRQITLFIPGIIFQVMVPITASSHADISIRNKIKANFQMNALVAVPTLIVLSALSPFIMEFYGRDFRQGWFIFVLLQCATFLQALQSPVVTQWIAGGQMWLNFAANLCWSSTLVILSWLLIGQGAQGLAIALLSSFALFGVVMLLLLPKTLNAKGACR
jgi:O-antigen/teichoic acid export membrane protein